LQSCSAIATVCPLLPNLQLVDEGKNLHDSLQSGTDYPKLTKGVVQMVNFLKNLHKDESGQDLIEYGLIGLIVALGAVAGMGTLAKSINGVFTQIASQLS